MAATSRLPQVAGAVITYTGDLGNGQYVSVVDVSANSYNPCVAGAQAAHAADGTHSGAQQAAGSSKAVTIPQSTLLQDDPTYTVCYAAGSGDSSDTTWRDSYVRLKISKIESLAAHMVTHYTDGQIARVGGTYQSWDGSAYQTVDVADLELTYSGSLSQAMWVSLVDQTLNSMQPCDSASEAAGSAGVAYSGPSQAAGGSKVVTVDTLGMSTTLIFAVCYAEGSGDSSDTTWADSGIRLTVSKVTSVE